MAEEYYKLNQNGIVARNELLLLLGIKPRSTGKLNGTFNAKEIKEDLFSTTLARDKSLTPLLNQTDETRSVSLDIIKQFFVTLLEKIADNYQEKYNSSLQFMDLSLLEKLKLNPIISNLELREYFIAYIKPDPKTKAKWDFPVDDLLEKVDYVNDSYQPSKDIPQKQDLFQQSFSLPNRSECEKIVDLLWHLDYQDQEDEFARVLQGSNQCMSFSVVAPCLNTQKWILKRLLRRIKLTDPQKIKVIGLNRHQMRLDPKLLWQELSPSSQMPLEQSEQNEIIKMLCSYATETPVIFVIHSFDKFESAQQYIVEKFWNKINSEMLSDAISFPLMLFLVDKCRPTCLPANITELAPLEMITQGHIENWSHRYKDFNYFMNELSQKKDWSTDEWKWTNPSSVIDRICYEFGFKNGIVDIEENWEWTL
ncbi:hypothetical protein [Chamaesiphon sp. OTE_75_metabat_556]|uniref:hypothetical protein n=1 Tax=Chamaesiphon sp. OTE_75_metabat_556 TaxID=2964692 RepID=UPI00286AB2E0|nr:hypothetical protein [Chamaesiphon sp. OTE_75_metabat_556]